MIGVPMEAGDALFFTENLRHGGLPNLLDTPRKTIHIMVCPRWATSQSPAHEDGDVYVSPAAWQRYSKEQRELLPAPSTEQRTSNSMTSQRFLEEEVSRLKSENERLTRQVRDLEAGKPSDAGKKSGWLSNLFR
jgi:ectoine hydroxylase-related dioxygenase (phytanoyl-CoA dioxygenase family)